MALKLSDWSTTAASNTSVDGISIAEGCPFANLNNSQRSIMASVRLEVASIGSNVSASGTPDIGSVGGALTMLGVTTVTGFATAPAGLVRTIHFETATPVVPGANLSAPFTSLTTSKGGVMVTRSLGSGAWKVEYASDYLKTQGKHKIWIPASAMRPSTLVPPAAADFLATDVQLYTLDFDQTSAEIAYFTLSMPSSWDEGTVTFVPVWTASAGSGAVLWNLGCAARSNDDAISNTFSGEVGSVDTLIATGDLHRGPESSALTVQGTPAANDTLFFRVYRLPTDGSDTLTADARLIGIELFITTDAAVDVA